MKRILFAGGLLMSCLALAAQTTSSAPAQGGAAAKKTQATQAQQPAAGTAMQTAGEQKFQQNCNRCHHAPQELSPRISGTVVMHMRVRAGLSEADAKAILRYLAP